MTILRALWTAKVTLSLESELDSHFGGVSPKRLQKGSQNGGKMVSESARGRPGAAPRAVPKKSRKMTSKSRPKGSQNGPQMPPKIG